MKVVAKILKVLAYITAFFGTTNVVVVLIGPAATWADNWWRILIIFAVAFGLAYLSGVLDAWADERRTPQLESGREE